MAEKLSFEVHGEVSDMDFDPEEWLDVDDIKTFEKQLIELAEEQATWGVHLRVQTIEDLWKEVQKAKEEDRSN